MSLRAILSRMLLLVLCLLQVATVAGFFVVLLTQPGIPRLAVLVETLSAGTLPIAMTVAAATALLAGPLAAMALWRLRLRGIVAGLLLAPLLLPLALPSFGDDPMGRALFLLDHASLGLALGTLCGVIRLGQLDLGVLRAAAHCGASPFGAMHRVVLPVMAPGILVSVLLSALVPLLLAVVRLSFGVDIVALVAPAAADLKVALLAACGATVLLAALASATVMSLRRP